MNNKIVSVIVAIGLILVILGGVLFIVREKERQDLADERSHRMYDELQIIDELHNKGSHNWTDEDKVQFTASTVTMFGEEVEINYKDFEPVYQAQVIMIIGIIISLVGLALPQFTKCTNEEKKQEPEE